MEKFKFCMYCKERYQPKSNNSKYCKPRCKDAMHRKLNLARFNLLRRQRYANNPVLRQQIKKQHLKYNLKHRYKNVDKEKYRAYYKAYNVKYKEKKLMLSRVRDLEAIRKTNKNFEKNLERDIKELKKYVKQLKKELKK